MFGGRGKAGEWGEGSLENRGVFCSLTGERGGQGLGQCREDGRRQRPWKAAGEEAFFGRKPKCYY